MVRLLKQNSTPLWLCMLFLIFLSFKRESSSFSYGVVWAKYNLGSLEYEEWSNHIQAWKLESTALIEPPCNFIVSSHAQGKRR